MVQLREESLVCLQDLSHMDNNDNEEQLCFLQTYLTSEWRLPR